MLIEVRDWREDRLAVGDLLYVKGYLAKVTRINKSSSGAKRVTSVKFKRLCKVKLKPYKQPLPLIDQRERYSGNFS